MATTTLADVYNPLVFASETQEKLTELNRFISSGIMVADAKISQMASVGGNIGELAFFKPLTMDEPNYSTDDENQESEAGNIDSSSLRYRLASQNKSWSVMDLTRELGLEDASGAITSSIGKFWAVSDERRLIHSVRGMIADNIANDNGDMIFDISATDGNAVAAANRADIEAVIDASQTMGDHASMLGAIAMHSAVYTRFKKLKALDEQTAVDAELGIRRLDGKVVIVDDSLVGVTYDATGTPKTYFDTILFGSGQFAYGEGSVMNPSEYLRDPKAGNGGGQETIFSRRANIIHPSGYSFTSTSVAGQSATYAELATAANWDRVVARKNVSLAVLRSNG